MLRANCRLLVYKSQNIVWSEGVSFKARQEYLQHKGATLWMTGLSGAGKSAIATGLEQVLLGRKIHTYRLDGDNIRFGLNRNLGFSPEDRAENIRRVGEVAQLFADACVVCTCSFISPYRGDRDLVRQKHRDAGLPFYEIYVHAPMDVLEQRDPKGLYKKAREGKIPEFTGISAPYEEPLQPDLILHTAELPLLESVHRLIALLEAEAIIPRTP